LHKFREFMMPEALPMCTSFSHNYKIKDSALAQSKNIIHSGVLAFFLFYQYHLY